MQQLAAENVERQRVALVQLQVQTIIACFCRDNQQRAKAVFSPVFQIAFRRAQEQRPRADCARHSRHEHINTLNDNRQLPQSIPERAATIHPFPATVFLNPF